MGGVAALRGRVIDLDTNAFVYVYVVEGFDPHKAFIEDVFRGHRLQNMEPCYACSCCYL